jgi:hypothetical protein
MKTLPLNGREGTAVQIRDSLLGKESWINNQQFFCYACHYEHRSFYVEQFSIYRNYLEFCGTCLLAGHKPMQCNIVLYNIEHRLIIPISKLHNITYKLNPRPDIALINNSDAHKFQISPKKWCIVLHLNDWNDCTWMS